MSVYPVRSFTDCLVANRALFRTFNNAASTKYARYSKALRARVTAYPRLPSNTALKANHTLAEPFAMLSVIRHAKHAIAGRHWKNPVQLPPVTLNMPAH